MEEVAAKTIVTRTKNTAWFGTEYNMNLYRGCCHGCIYCDSRSDCYRVGDFDRVRVKKDALEIVRNDLRRKAKPGVVATGAMSDPYNPFEEELQLTRHALELLNAFGFGVAVATKSDLVKRDADLLREIGEHSPALVKMTVTTCDDALARLIEPYAPPPSRRLDALDALAGEGVFCGVLLMPVLPFLEDSEENVLTVARRAKEAGARFVYPMFGMTMREGQREYYYGKLRELFPKRGLPERYQRRYFERYECRSPNASRLWAAFRAECGRLGLLYEMKEIIRAYRLGYRENQLTFF